MIRRAVSATAWACLAFITFATLAPYAMRPELTETEPSLIVMIERLGAYAVLGLLFFISYPARTRTVCLIVFGSAIALEFGQVFLPDRHAGLVDVLEKLVGGGTGMLLGAALSSALSGPSGLLVKIDKQWLNHNVNVNTDSERYELLAGTLTVVLFGLTLVLFQKLTS